MTVELTIQVGNAEHVIPGQDDITDTVNSWVAWIRENATNGVYSAETADGSWVVIPLNRIDAIWGHPEPSLEELDPKLVAAANAVPDKEN